MSLFGVADKILAYFTPEQLKARARAKKAKLERMRDELQKKPSTPANRKRWHKLTANINILQDYLANR